MTSNSFKQKLKALLNDSPPFKDMSNIDQKFDQFLLRTYRKIKKDNTRQSIIVSNFDNNYSNYNRKTTRNFLFNNKKSGNKRGISPNIAERMVQTFSLMKEENSKNIYNNYQSEKFYNAINKYMQNSSKIKRKIQRDIDYITKDKYNSTIKCSSRINRPKSVFNNNTINNFYPSNKNKTIDNRRKIFETNKERAIKQKEDKNGGIFRNHIKKGKIDFNDYFNQFRNRQKFINFNF